MPAGAWLSYLWRKRVAATSGRAAFPRLLRIIMAIANGRAGAFARPAPCRSPPAGARPSGSGRCCRPGRACSTIAAPLWPSPTRSSSACCSSTAPPAHRRRIAAGRPRGGQARARTLGHRADLGEQSSVGRSDAVACGHSDDAGDRRRRQATRHFRARPHHRPKEGHKGIAIDLSAPSGGCGRQTSAAGFDYPARDPGPIFGEDRSSHEQSTVAAGRHRLANGVCRGADQALGCQ